MDSWELLARVDCLIRLSEAATKAQQAFNLNRTTDRAAEICFKSLHQAHELLADTKP